MSACVHRHRQWHGVVDEGSWHYWLRMPSASPLTIGEIAKIMSEQADYLRFWGKQEARLRGRAWHAAAYHCLDVAASARALLEANDLLRHRLAELLAIPERQVVDLVRSGWRCTMWVSSPLRSALKLRACGCLRWATARRPERSASWGGRVSAVGQGTRQRSSAWFPDGRRLVPLARAIFGHHGQPVAERLPTTVTQVYRPYGLAAARAFARDAANLLLRPNTIGPGAPGASLVRRCRRGRDGRLGRLVCSVRLPQ